MYVVVPGRVPKFLSWFLYLIHWLSLLRAVGASSYHAVAPNHSGKGLEDGYFVVRSSFAPSLVDIVTRHPLRTGEKDRLDHHVQ